MCKTRACMCLLRWRHSQGPDGTAAARAHPNRQSGYETGRSEGLGQRIPRHYLRSGVHQPGWHLAAYPNGREWHRVSEPSSQLAILDVLFNFLLCPRSRTEAVESHCKAHWLVLLFYEWVKFWNEWLLSSSGCVKKVLKSWEQKWVHSREEAPGTYSAISVVFVLLLAGVCVCVFEYFCSYEAQCGLA